MQCVLSTQPMITGVNIPEMLQQNERLKEENDHLKIKIHQYEQKIELLADSLRKNNESLKEKIEQERKNRLIDRHQYEQTIETLQLELKNEEEFSRELVEKLKNKDNIKNPEET